MTRVHFIQAGVLCGILCSASSLTGCQAPTPTAAKSPRRTPVKVVAVAQTDLERTTTQPATIHAYYRAEIRAQATGYVKQLEADIGDVVQQGASLAVVDVPQLARRKQIMQGKIKSCQAAEAQHEAGIELAKARVQSSIARLAEAESQLDRIEANLVAVTAEFERTQDLVQRQSLQDRVLDEARAKRDAEQANKVAAESSIQSARAEVDVAEAQVAVAQAELDSAQAQTEIARSELEELQVLIDYATLRAPFSGVITGRMVEPGELVRAASDTGDGKPLFIVSRVDKLRIRVPVPENDAPLITTGDEIQLTFPSFPAEAFEAQVTRTSSSLDPSTRTMTVEAELENPDGKLLPGMFGQATIGMSNKVAANTLPARAVRFTETGEAYVYLVGPDETVTVREVEAGMDDGRQIEILAGLEPGQRVIDAHLKRFVTGQKVDLLN